MLRNKFLFSIMALSFIVVITAKGQNEDNALTYSYTKPTGTARSIALGGAMGALGGDYSAITINPAGIGIYRSSEFAFTPGFTFNQTESNYFDNLSTENNSNIPLNHISYVGTSRLLRDEASGFISTHFGIGYTRTNNYNQKSYITAENIQSSMLDEVVHSSRGKIKDENSLLTNHPFYFSYLLNPLPLLYPDNYFAHNDLIIDNTQATESDQYYHGWEYIDWNNPSIDQPNDTIYSVLNGIPNKLDGNDYGLKQRRIIEESGYQGEYNLTFGANYNNKILLGGAVNLATTFNQKEFVHNESNPNEIYYDDYIAFHEDGQTVLKEFTYTDYEKTSGVGINLNFGVIYKPIHNLRVGASFKTPTFYSMNMEYDIKVSPQFFDIEEQEAGIFYGESSFNFKTPLNLTGSIAYIFGNNGLISVDYNYKDYSSMEYKAKGGDINLNYLNTSDELENLNDIINETFRPTHNIRIGAEYRILQMVSLRGGYNYFQNPYQETYLNANGEHYNITGGLGFRSGNMTIDVAYLYNYETYIHSLYYSPELADEIQQPADITAIDHHLALTLGWRF